MSLKDSYYKKLILDFVCNKIPGDKLEELLGFTKTHPDQYDLLMKDPDVINAISQKYENMKWQMSEQSDNRIKKYLSDYTNRQEVPNISGRSIYKTRIIRRISIAASIIILLGISAFFYLSTKNKNEKKGIAKSGVSSPLHNKAVITLSNGQQVFLKDLQNGQLAQQGNMNVVRLANGSIAYEPIGGINTNELLLNTLLNPKGSAVVNIQLSDGTKLWLNAGSSVTYPVVFPATERKIELQGEAYFEVAHNPSKKFIVVAGGAKTEVLGTHFNVNAYPTANSVKVALLEGRVKVSAENTSSKKNVSKILLPGQESVVTSSNITVGAANLEQVMAWKNGLFNFNDLSIRELMEQIGVWYDLKIVYPNGIPDVTIGGEMGRDLSLPEMLQALKDMNVNCSLSGNTLTVKN